MDIRTVWVAISQYKGDSLLGLAGLMHYNNGVPAIFRTKRECKEWIDKEYYCYRRRPKRQRHKSWRLPKPVKAVVKVLKDDGTE